MSDDGWTRCPHTDPNGRRCDRRVIRVTSARKPARTAMPRHYELDGLRHELAKGARLGETTGEGQAVYCPRGHRVSVSYL